MEECMHPTLGMRVRSDGSVFVKGRWPSTSHWTKGAPICNGKRGWLPTAIALDFRKLPKVERTPELYQKLKQEGKHA
jgi:hypothetical protein